MKTLTYKVHRSVIFGCFILFFPLMLACSSLTGGGMSDDPEVAQQQMRVQQLERELEEAERLAEEASQREKAAKDRLKAAEHELKALETQAERRSQ